MTTDVKPEDGCSIFLQNAGMYTSNNRAPFFGSSSLALLPFKFGLGFPHDKDPFSSVQNSCPLSFYTCIPKVWFNIIHST
jgi:hypothetical protein